MATIIIICPACGHSIKAEHFKDAYCTHCDTTHEADTEIVDIYIGSCSYTLTGNKVPGKVPDDYFVKK